MELFTIHASKDGEWVETQGTSPTLTVAKANIVDQIDRIIRLRPTQRLRPLFEQARMGTPAPD